MSGSPLMDRFQIIDSPQFHPGQCAICGTAKGPFLDLRTDIRQMAGVYRLYFCFADLKAMMDTVERYTGAETEGATRSLTSLLEQKNLIGVPRELFDNIVGAATLLSASVDSLSDLDLDYAESDEADGKGDDPGPADDSSGQRKPRERNQPEPSLTF